MTETVEFSNQSFGLQPNTPYTHSITGQTHLNLEHRLLTKKIEYV